MIRGRVDTPRRIQVKKEYGEFFDEISALLVEADPIGIDYADNTGELSTT